MRAGDSPGYIEKQFAVLYACPPIRCFDWGRYTYTSAFYCITKCNSVFDFIIIFRELQNKIFADIKGSVTFFSIALVVDVRD